MRKTFLVLIIGIIGLFTIGCGPQNQQQNVAANQEHAREWVQKTLPGYDLKGFNSATLDSDGDGYVSVDITVQKIGTTELRLIKLQCPTASSGYAGSQVGTGCKFDSMPYESKF